MARIIKKGTEGALKEFITRRRAVAKLQVSLADFRRLCIFKGIYPREPRNKRKANRGNSKPTTFYYTKDIKYLMHEPVLAKFREHKTFCKKLARALNRNELGDADRLEHQRPRYTLNHIVRERYPTFVDALRDLDDPLNMLFLFANMPATGAVGHRVTREAEKLTNHWLAYVARERLIKKVFVSIKGVYYLATIKGQEVRWLVPFKFPTKVPAEVDLRIMITFMELYSTLLHFVLFKLYSDASLVYPPPVDTDKLKSVGGLSAYVMTSKEHHDAAVRAQAARAASERVPDCRALSSDEIHKAKAGDARQEPADGAGAAEEQDVESAQLDHFAPANRTPGDVLNQPSQHASPTATLFANFTFFVNREVPMDILELCILSAGGKVVSEIELDEMRFKLPDAYLKLDLSTITHLIIDRPQVPNKVAGRTYVQPQWVFDSINKAELLPVGEYAPGETLPPHLSPWGDRGTYEVAADAKDDSSSDEEDGEEEDGEEEENDSEDEEEKADVAQQLKEQKELEMEAAGVKFSEVKETAQVKKKKRASMDDERELRKIMMTGKQKQLYDTIQGEAEREAERTRTLAKKKKLIQKGKEGKK